MSKARFDIEIDVNEDFQERQSKAANTVRKQIRNQGALLGGTIDPRQPPFLLVTIDAFGSVDLR